MEEPFLSRNGTKKKSSSKDSNLKKAVLQKKEPEKSPPTEKRWKKTPEKTPEQIKNTSLISQDTKPGKHPIRTPL